MIFLCEKPQSKINRISYKQVDVVCSTGFSDAIVKNIYNLLCFKEMYTLGISISYNIMSDCHMLTFPDDIDESQVLKLADELNCKFLELSDLKDNLRLLGVVPSG